MNKEDEGNFLVSLLERHPLSKLCGDMPTLEFDELGADIKKHGVLTPIVMYEGKVLDGWHRYQAALRHDRRCLQAGRGFKSDKEAQDFVLSANLHRRHLNPGARASLVVSVREWKPEGRPKETPSFDGVNPEVVESKSKSSKEMASEAQVSVPTIERAKAAASGKRKSVPTYHQEREIDAAALEVYALRQANDKLTSTNIDLEERIALVISENQSVPAAREILFNNLRSQIKTHKASVMEWQTRLREAEKENSGLRAMLRKAGVKIKK